MKRQSTNNSYCMDIRNIKVMVSRRNIKNLNLYIRPPHGEVLITVPIRTSDAYIYAFLMRKYDWIVHNKDKMNSVSSENTITDQQRDHLKQLIAFYAEIWEPILGVHCNRWTVRRMTTRWGSCSVSKGTIRMNLLLAVKPELCVEYVVVHELVHMLEPSHNHVFKNYMSRFLPDWKERERMLKLTSDEVDTNIIT